MFTSKEDNLSGYIIYINDITNEFQYKDPKLIEILNNVKEKYNQIKYTTYRCSAKLLALKKVLYTHYIPYTTVVSSIIERHGFNQIDTIECITPSQLTALIHDIFYASQKFHYFKNYPNFKLQTSIEILSNFFWNIFDPNRNQSISILELKQTLLILCDTNSFEQIIYEHFLLNADHNRCVTQFRFESMIKILSKLFSYIDDDHDVGGDNHKNIRNLYYRPNRISEIVHECFQQCPGIVGLNEYQFHCLWKKSTIKFSCYSNVFDLIKRLNNSQQILHNVECTACQTIPIRGLRFKCQHCKTLSLCFNCFCVGYANHHHELSHRMYEISSIEISPNKLRTFLSKLCYIFTRNNSMDQLSSNMTLETKLVNDIDENTLQANSRDYDPINNVIVNDEVVCTDPDCGGSRGEDDDDIVDDQQIKLNTLYTSQLSNGSEIIRIISNNNNNNNNNYNNNNNINNNINNNYKHNNNNNNNNNNNYIPEKLMKIIEMLTEENITLQNKLENNLNNNKNNNNNNKKLLKFFENNQAASLKKLSFNKYLESHIINLTDAINQLRCIWQHSISLQLPYASTPLRRNSCKRATDLYSPLSRSIHGSEINKTFLENNKSDLTVGDISSWYLDKQSLTSNKRDNNCDKLQILCETDMANNMDTEMNNFKLLIQRVKEIIDDSYSDNFELSQATNRLEKVLDRIIDEEEKKRNDELNVFF